MHASMLKMPFIYVRTLTPQPSRTSRITREPRRHEYPTKGEFVRAWERWRDIRNRNNTAVSGVLLT